MLLYLMHAGVHVSHEQCNVGHWRLAERLRNR